MQELELAKLQREWRKKLRDEGFDDIEYDDGSLKVACHENRGMTVLEYENTLEYFSRAEDFLFRRGWSDELERDVWRRHTEGETLREICAAHGRTVKWAFGHIEKLRVEMARWWDMTREDRRNENMPTVKQMSFTWADSFARKRTSPKAHTRNRLVKFTHQLDLPWMMAA